MKIKKSWLVLAIIAVVLFLGITRPPKPASLESEQAEQSSDEVAEESSAKKPTSKKKAAKATDKSASDSVASNDVRSKNVGKKSFKALPVGSSGDSANSVDVVRYVIDDGLAVIQGDLVVGVPVDDNGATSGLVQVPTIALWKSREIPVYVQPNLTRPDRVRQAFELFSDSVIRFVPYTDQEDVLIFEEGSGVCKSYVGRVGGKQPIWISPGCEATEVAHEILHALGFVHEQNRQDRDNFVEVLPDNIEEAYKYNFDKLPESTMKLNGLSAFDFESLMIYPDSMFAKPGTQTMRSKTETPIRPSTGLSAKDKERLQKAYGNL